MNRHRIFIYTVLQICMLVHTYACIAFVVCIFTCCMPSNISANILVGATGEEAALIANLCPLSATLKAILLAAILTSASNLSKSCKSGLRTYVINAIHTLKSQIDRRRYTHTDKHTLCIYTCTAQSISNMKVNIYHLD